MNGANGQITKAEMEKLIEKASNSAPAQIIRLEHAPLIIKTESTKEPPINPVV